VSLKVKLVEWIQNGSLFLIDVQVARDKPYSESEVSPQLHRSLWHSLAYTIMAAEAYHRDQQMSFFGENVPIRRKMGLKFLTRLCSVSVDSNFYPVSISDLYWVRHLHFYKN